MLMVVVVMMVMMMMSSTKQEVHNIAHFRHGNRTTVTVT